MKDFYDKKFKSSKKESKEGIRRRKKSPMLMDHLTKSNLQVQVIPTRIPTQFFADLERTILSFIWKNEKTQDSDALVF